MPPDEGASPTPLWRKLGVHDGDTVTLVDAPAEFDVPDLPPRIVLARESPTAPGATSSDVIVAFFRHAEHLEPALHHLAPRICPAGALWLAWPRRAAGHESDLGDVVVRDIALGFGLVDVKVAALGHDWSGLRFVWRKELRQPSSPTRPPRRRGATSDS